MKRTFCKYCTVCESLLMHMKKVVLFISLLWLYCSIFLYFWTLNYTVFFPLARTLHLVSVYGFFGWNASSSPPLLSFVLSLLHPRPPAAPQRCPPLFFLAKTTGLYWSCRQRHKHKLATSGSSPHDRDESLSGWKEEFKRTDKYSFIATYLKQLITYGRWCGIFSVGCLWTNSVVLCKLPIWPSLCIFLTLVALHSHVLWAEGLHRQRDKGLPVYGDKRLLDHIHNSPLRHLVSKAGEEHHSSWHPAWPSYAPPWLPDCMPN